MPTSQAVNPVGWYLRCKAPADVVELVDWLATRTTWLHEYMAGRVEPINPCLADAMRRELPARLETPLEACFRAGKPPVALYFRDLIANVVYWLDDRAFSGHQNWVTPPNDDPKQLVKADDYLLALLNWLRTNYVGKQRPPSPQLTVNLDCKTITLDEETHDVDSEHALQWVKVLAEHPGEWISSKEVPKYNPLLLGLRTDRLLKYLPQAVKSLIDSETGKGSRIRL